MFNVQTVKQLETKQQEHEERLLVVAEEKQQLETAVSELERVKLKLAADNNNLIDSVDRQTYKQCLLLVLSHCENFILGLWGILVLRSLAD